MKSVHWVYLLLTVLWMSACTSAEVTTPPEYPVKDKTVIVYMAADNDLSSNAINNLEELKQGFLPSSDNLVVYYHTPDSNPKLLRLYRDEAGAAAVDTLYRFPDYNSALPSSLNSALKVAATLCPAQEYGLILWSHATGWLPQGYYSSGEITSFSAPVREKSASLPAGMSGAPETENDFVGMRYIDDPYADLIKMSLGRGAVSRSFASEDGREMDVVEMVKALPYRFSYIIFDACLMGGIEVAYQLKDSTDYILFSPAEVLAKGFPYSRIMEPLFRTPADVREVGDLYYDYYNNQGGESRAATISLVKTSELENVAAVAARIFEKYREKIALLNMNAIQRYFRFNLHWFYDLEDFIGQLADSRDAAEFSAALQKAVIYKAATPYFLSIPIVRFSGISTYIPNPANEVLDNYYRQYEWNKATGMIAEPAEGGSGNEPAE